MQAIRGRKLTTNKVFLAWLFCLLFEVVYSPGSGSYNLRILLVTSVLFGLKLIMSRRQNILKLSRENFISLILLCYILLYSYSGSRESIRYFLTFFIVWQFKSLRVRNLRRFFVLLILIGFAFSLKQFLLDGVERVSGYRYSPTIFSYELIIAIYYLENCSEKKKTDWIYYLICLFCIYFSKSRSTILAVIGIICEKSIRRFLERHKGQKRVAWIYIGLFLLLALIVAMELYEMTETRIFRSNALASTNTRLFMLRTFFEQLQDDWKMLLFGEGGGYTVSYLYMIRSSFSHLPLHQDVLMLVCEYGLIGSSFIIWHFVAKRKMNFIQICILLLGTFHNIVISPITVMLFCIMVKALRTEKRIAYLDKDGRKRSCQK